MAIGFDLETFNRRTDLWRHKASLSPSLGGEIRLAQLHGADSDTTLVIDLAVIGQPAVDWLETLVRLLGRYEQPGEHDAAIVRKPTDP